MSVILALLSKYWPYLAAAGLGAAIGSWTTHGFDSIALNRQKTAMASYKAQVADQAAAGEKAAREALQAQIDQRLATDLNNQRVMDELKQRTADAESHFTADRDAIRGLLNAASHSPQSARGSSVPETRGGPAIAAASASGSIDSISAACAALAAEDELNANEHDALTAQVTPQVEP